MSTAPATSQLPRRRVVGGLALGLLAVSTAGVLGTVALGDPPQAELGLVVAFYRCAGGALALAPLALRQRGDHPLSRRDLRRLGLSGAFLALHFGLFLASLGLTTVTSAVTLATASPVFVALAAARWLGETPSRRTAVGMTIAMAGAVGLGLADLQGLPLGPRALLGDAMALGAAVAVAGYLVIGRAVRRRVPLATYSAVVYGVAAALLLAACLLAGAPLTGHTGSQWLAILGVLVGPQLLGHTVFNGLLSSVRAEVVSTVVLAEPLIAALLAWVFIGQLPSLLTWIAAPVVLTGLVLAVRGGPRATPAG